MNNKSFIVTGKSEIEVSLADYQGEDAPLKCKISIEPYGIAIAFEGYGECTSEKSGSIIFIEQTKGIPRMLVWDDINKEESVREIGFEGAREDLRHGYGDQIDMATRETIGTIWTRDGEEVGFIDSDPDLGLRAWFYDGEADDPFDKAAIADYQSLIERIQSMGYLIGGEFGKPAPKNEKFIDYTNTGDVAG